MSQTLSCTMSFILQGTCCDDSMSQWIGPEGAEVSLCRGVDRGLTEMRCCLLISYFVIGEQRNGILPGFGVG